ncbi:MAG: VWA domain-containing protein [Gaiellaceae bacterium]
MEIAFLTPLAALLAVAAFVPLAVYRARDRRLTQIRATLGLDEPSRRSHISLLAALVAVCGLLGLAAAQPVVATTRTLPERTDAQVFVVLDTSRSMYASARSGAPTRFERARAIAVALRDELPDVPVGIASMTDGVLPHLFPTTDRRVFIATIEDSIDIERPPPILTRTLATSLEGLSSVPTANYFAPAAKKRVLVVLSDGESQPLDDPGAFEDAFRKQPQIETIFVRLWDEDERIYLTGVAEVGYEPDQASGELVESVASLIEGQVLEESESRKLGGIVAGLLGDGPTIGREHEGRRRALMPWITLLVVVPLGYVLVRRNL